MEIVCIESCFFGFFDVSLFLCSPPPQYQPVTNTLSRYFLTDYQFPPLTNLNNLPRYSFTAPSQGQTTSLPPFNSITQGVDEGVPNPSPASKDNIKLPSADSLLKSPQKKHGEKVPPLAKFAGPQEILQPGGDVVDKSAASPSVPEQIVPHTNSEHEVTATQAQVQAPEMSENGANYKPLNVKDALYYLDQVKLKFKNKTDVYNNFLDIMKDFKSHNIDTPGVIERVSSLFKGHPELISGFNTFLPQGFSIECSPTDTNTIVVTTPMGTSIRRDSAELNDLHPQHKPEDRITNTVEAHIEQDRQLNGPTSVVETGNIQHVPSNANEEQKVEAKQSTPAEFDQAINYVNKIKQRYASQPDIYKLFLENLQMYQKGIKPINEVYREISVLFRDAPDLLEDFKLFMPDNTVIREPPQEYAAYSNYYGQNVQLPPVGNFQSGPYPGDQAIMVAPQFGVDQQTDYQNYPKPQIYAEEAQVKTKGKKGSVPSISQMQTVQNQGHLQPYDEFPVSNLRGSLYEQQTPKPALISGVLEPVYPKMLDTDLTNEIAFFDKVKKAVGNKQTYNEFLKLLKLYSSDVIDKNTLHNKSRAIIGGSPELFEWFKKFIGYEEKPLRIEDIAIKKQQIDLLMCKAEGPSYRLLPKSQTKMPCSGRDDLCKSVFNDEWVGHPVWASEESGFIAHRKNQYEEMLFRIEDERHEYDYYMEANLRTIQTLETIANRMASMTPEEKAKFKLPVGLGHTSSTIYMKVIRKIYDKDRGWEVIDALHENPAVAVPIVLKRLKQKDEEWRRVHREWNKVWREAEQKLLIKSLDHLGLSFKNIDKKLLTNKQLVSELSTIKQEQNNKLVHPLMTRQKREIITKYDDFSIFMDILKLVHTNIKRNQLYSQNDKDRMETFMKSFLIKFFFLDSNYIDEELKNRGIVNDHEAEQIEGHVGEHVGSNMTLSTLSQTKKRPREYDLLKNVLRKNKRKKIDQQAQPVEETVLEEEPTSEEAQKAQSNWISDEVVEDNQSEKRDEFNFFVNTQIYVFYRHLDTLYKRLLEIKKMSPEVNKEIKSRVDTKFAVDLGLLDHHLEDMGVAIKGDDSYGEALELCVKLIDSKIEQSTFEESLRNGFRNKAFKLFTIDRVIQNLMKHCHTIVSDSKCSEILMLMEKDRNHLTTSIKDQILYRVQVRSFMNPDENMFKILYNKATFTTTITFLALDDLTIKDSSDTKDSKWKYYLTSYSMSHPTEGLDPSKINVPFLRSQLNMEQENEDEIEGVVDSKLAVKIDKDTYRMRFEPESYDLFIRNSLYKTQPSNTRTKKLRLLKLASIVDGDYGIAGELKEDGLKLANERLQVLVHQGPEEYLKFEHKQKQKQIEAKDEHRAAMQNEEVRGDTSEMVSELKQEVNSVGDTQTDDKMEIDQVSKNEEAANVKVNQEEKSVIANSMVTEASEERKDAAEETTVFEGDSTIQQDETMERVDI